MKHTKTPWFQRFSRETSCFNGLLVSFPHIIEYFLRKPFQGSKMLKFQRFAVILKVFTQSYSFILLFIPECICFTLHVCIYDSWPDKGYKRIYCKHVYIASLLFSTLISVLSDFLPKEDSLYVFKTNIAETSVLDLLKAGGYLKSNNLTRIIIRLYMQLLLVLLNKMIPAGTLSMFQLLIAGCHCLHVHL